jgi:hypothetical protein
MAIVLLAVAAAAVWTMSPRPPTGPDIPRLQALATQSCRCARTRPGGDGKRACWAEFERQASRFEPSEYFTACQPVSPSGYCFGEDVKACVVKEYAKIPDASLCSEDEARIAMAAFEEASRRREQGDATADPDKAVVAVSQALARGARLAASSADPGCVG